MQLYRSYVTKYFPAHEVDNAMRIMKMESGYNPRAHNGNAQTGDDSWGLMQINRFGKMAYTRPAPDVLVDPESNIRVAAGIWKYQGWCNGWRTSATKLGMCK